MAVLTALPILTLMIFGLAWLIHAGWWIPGFIGMSVAGGCVVLLGYSIQHTQKIQTNRSQHEPDQVWAPSEVQAWDTVQTLAAKAQVNPPMSFEAAQDLADAVVQSIAKNLHGNGDFVWARFTVPEILNAIEEAARHLRDSLQTRVPGSQSISVADVLVMRHFYLTHSAKIAKAYAVFKLGKWMYRIARFVTNPPVAIGQEIRGMALDASVSSGSQVVHGWMTRLFVEELGRSAINLYSGRYRLNETEAKQSLIESAPVVTRSVPIRVLIAGQVNAGKSSLTNALLGSIKSPVSELPTPGGIREFRIETSRNLDLVVVDTPGLTSIGGNKQTLLDACENVDLIIWVAQANNPARAIDVAALTEIRAWFKSRPQIKPPPMALAMTHIDKLSPSKEWSPPYDIAAALSPKARNIRRALEQVLQVLEFDDAPGIPLSLPPNQQHYNLDALWATIAVVLSEAQLTALDRELKLSGGFSVQKTFDQCYQGGRFMVSKLWADHFGRTKY